MRYFEDFVVGAVESYGSATAEQADMLAFAREFDPQPMHLDPASEQAAMVGGLIASGWHTAAINMRLMADHFIIESSGMGSPGVSILKWLAPVRPGDRLSGTMTVLGKRTSATRRDRGLVEFRFELVNQAGTPVLEQVNLILFGRRAPGTEAEIAASGGAITRPQDETFPIDAHAAPLGFIEEIAPGTIVRFGDYRFAAESMIRFARRFDPQAFHLSEAAGRASHFGGLSASGWHTAAAWMRTVIDFWQGLEVAHRASGAPSPLPRRGPGFGFTDLHWRRPVLAGDTLTYFARVIEARRSASKPGWGILTQRNYALNQHGVAVFAFTGSVMWESRTPMEAR